MDAAYSTVHATVDRLHGDPAEATVPAKKARDFSGRCGPSAICVKLITGLITT